MKSADVMLLERCAQSPVSFTHAVTIVGRRPKLVRSTIGPKQQAPMHQLAVAGYLSEKVTGCPHDGETTVTYTLTALGREAMGIYQRSKPARYARPWPTDAQLERESREPV